MSLIRQGDVILRRIAAPKSLSGLVRIDTRGGEVVLAHGEVTGHKHRVRVVEAYSRPDGSIVVRATDVGDPLVHEEHTAAPLAPGQWYESWRQCQWNVEGGSNVAD